MNMMISYQELVRTFPKATPASARPATIIAMNIRIPASKQNVISCDFLTLTFLLLTVLFLLSHYLLNNY